MRMIIAICLIFIMTVCWAESNPLDLSSEILPHNPQVRAIYIQTNDEGRDKGFQRFFHEVHDSVVLDEGYYFYFLSLKQAERNQSILSLLRSWETKIPSFRTALAATYYLLSDPATIELGFLYRFINRGLASGNPDPAWWNFMKGILLARRGMNGAAYETLHRQSDFFSRNPSYDFYYWLGKTAYDTDHWEQALDYLSRAYRLKPDMGVYNLIDVTAQKRGLSSEEERMLFQRLMKPTLEKAADFNLVDLDGVTWSLEGVKGRYLLLVFWASWCGPCRKELPLIEAFQQQKPDNLVILGINTEGRADLAAGVKQQLGLSFPILPADASIQANYGVQSIPRSILVDPEGRIILRIVGASPRIQTIVMDRIRFITEMNASDQSHE
ncbi:MAG: redoxin family protein [Candidatus Delongbacteria bacterium]|nr:redoxin family protein [Candidatus Delongbacteria bacterium]